MVKIEKCTKLSIAVISATLLLMLVRGCAAELKENYQVDYTNNQKPAYNYSEYFKDLSEQMDKIIKTEQNRKIK